MERYEAPVSLEMLGLPEWACMTTRSMAARKGDQKELVPETVAQVPPNRKGRGHRKPTPEVSTVWEEADLEADAWHLQGSM